MVEINEKYSKYGPILHKKKICQKIQKNIKMKINLINIFLKTWRLIMGRKNLKKIKKTLNKKIKKAKNR